MPVKRKSVDQKAAEAVVKKFRHELGPFVVAAEMTRIPTVFTNARSPGDPIIFANESFLRLTGYARKEVLARNFNFIMGDRNKPMLAEILAVCEEGYFNGPEIRCNRKDGSVLWATIFITPVKDNSGEIIEHFASFIDTTRSRQEVERLHFLLDELDHCTQNTLTIVLSIAAQTLRGVADKGAISVFEERIRALSKAHCLLGRKDWHCVSLRDVIDQILQPFGLNDHRVSRFSVEGDEVPLQPKTALTLALVFHELATNAAKYGTLSNDSSGKIDITWQVEPTPQGDRMRLRWQESGGPPVMPPATKGFGSRLIEGGLAQELDGEVSIDYAPAGVVCQIVMPIPRKGGKL